MKITIICFHISATLTMTEAMVGGEDDYMIYDDINTLQFVPVRVQREAVSVCRLDLYLEL